MGLLGVWNISFLGYPCRAILPYAQALSKLAPHIQQARTIQQAHRKKMQNTASCMEDLTLLGFARSADVFNRRCASSPLSGPVATVGLWCSKLQCAQCEPRSGAETPDFHYLNNLRRRIDLPEPLDPGRC